MNKFNYIRTCLPAAASLLLLSGCIDDNYDLDNIDTTTEIKADNLTVPINLDGIKLEKMIDIDENDPNAAIKIITIGNEGKRYYAVQKGGTFSATTTVAKVNAPASEAIRGTNVTISASTPMPSAKRAAAGDISFSIPEETTSFSYNVTDVDPAILSIKRLDLDMSRQMHLNITLKATELAHTTESITFENLSIILPEGLKAYYGKTETNGSLTVIPAADGHLVIPEVSGNASGINVEILVSGIDLAAMYGEKGLEVTDRAFNFGGAVGIASGTLHAAIAPGLSASDIPSSVTLSADYSMSSFTVDKFSGKIDYSIDMGYIPPVDLSDLPDFLNSDETDLKLVNPQINLVVTNPVAQYGLDCVSGLTISAERGNDSQAQVLERFTIGHDAETQSIIMAPDPVNNIYPTFAGSKPQVFEGLSNILSGAGLPKRLKVELTSALNPKPAVKGEADGFQLGVPLAVNGEYTFFTTLAVADGSRIVYSKQEDGWNDDDVKDIRITRFEVNAEAVNELPFGATLNAWPVVLDASGHPVIERSIHASTSLNASSAAQPFSLTFTRTDGSDNILIENLDGIYFEADIDTFNGEPLAPEQTITINKIRATVSGSYIKEL